MIKQARAAKAKVLLLGMQIPPNYGLAYTRGFLEMYPKLAKQHGISLVPFMLEGIAADEFQADNLHPTAPVQPKILDTVMQQLKALL